MDKRNVDESFRLMYNTAWTKRNVDESFRLMYNTPWAKEMLMNRLD